MSWAIILISLISLNTPILGNRHEFDDRIITLDTSDIRNQLSFAEENESFLRSEICVADNSSRIGFCASNKPVNDLFALQSSKCFCDELCHYYHDCCLDKVRQSDKLNPNYSCKIVKNENSSRIPIYVVQTCQKSWSNSYVQTLCEKDAVVLEKEGQSFNHLQDIPVLSKMSQIFYRNVYCAICNDDTDLYKWSSYVFCNGDSTNEFRHNDEDYDFSTAVYKTRDMIFRRVKVAGKLKNCQIVIRDFKLSRLLELGARLCKPVIDTCPVYAPIALQEKCKAFTSFVYEDQPITVYKNFHCALCNDVPKKNLLCTDPEFPIIHSGQAGRIDLSWLFDFNFKDENNQVGNRDSCRLSDGQLFDPILKSCQNFTCGSLYVREGTKCIPKNTSEDGTSGSIKSDCPKIILSKDMFSLESNGSVYLKDYKIFLNQNDFEVYEEKAQEITKIIVCAIKSNLLPRTYITLLLSEITLSLSIICLILHLSVYTLLEELRNGPGKILMCLSSSLLCGHFFLLIGPHFSTIDWLCYISAVATHFGYIASFIWMSVMAYDIHRTFSATQSRHSKQRSFFIYSMCSWVSALSIVAISITMDYSLDKDFQYRPRYGGPICWFNNKKGLLIFFVSPVLILLVSNIAFFSLTAFYLNKVSRQTQMVNNFSDRTRYFLYIKLSSVLGLTWIIGFFAGITGLDVLWYPFIILNGLQGVFIFISFTIKRKILQKLAVKFKLRSSSYKMGKQSAIKKAMYSSLSSLSTLGTTLTSQIVSTEKDEKNVLKSMRKINSDLL